VLDFAHEPDELRRRRPPLPQPASRLADRGPGPIERYRVRRRREREQEQGEGAHHLLNAAWYGKAMRIAALLLLLLGVAFAQDDDGIEVGDVGDPIPPAEEEEANDAPPKEPSRPLKREPGAKVKTREVKDAEGRYVLALPEDWALEPVEGKGVLAFDVWLPGASARAFLKLSVEHGIMDPRTTPYRWRFDNKLEVSKKEVVQEPLPAVIVHHEARGGKRVLADVLRQIRGNVFVLRLECAEADFAVAREDLFDALRSFEADVDVYPPIPEGYRTEREGDFLFVVHGSVEASLRPLEKALKAQVKRFEKIHGRLETIDGEPIQVLVHLNRMQGGKILEGVAESTNDFYHDVTNARLFAVPLTKGNTEAEGHLASTAQGLFFRVKYGSIDPRWIWVGESSVARAEVVTGRRLPYLHAGFAAWGDNLTLLVPEKLDESLQKSNWGSFSRQSFFYVASFHRGRSKYRRAYKAFLKDYAETHDWKGAWKRRLSPLGSDAIRDAAQEFLWRRIKRVEPDSE